MCVIIGFVRNGLDLGKILLNLSTELLRFGSVESHESLDEANQPLLTCVEDGMH